MQAADLPRKKKKKKSSHNASAASQQQHSSEHSPKRQHNRNANNSDASGVAQHSHKHVAIANGDVIAGDAASARATSGADVKTAANGVKRRASHGANTTNHAHSFNSLLTCGDGFSTADERYSHDPARSAAAAAATKQHSFKPSRPNARRKLDVSPSVVAHRSLGTNLYPPGIIGNGKI